MKPLSSLSLFLSGFKTIDGRDGFSSNTHTDTNYKHTLYENGSYVVDQPTSISVTHEAFAPSTNLFVRSTITSDANPMDLSLSLVNNAVGVNPDKWALIRPVSDPAYGLQNTTITGSDQNDTLTISVKESVSMGYLRDIKSVGMRASTIDMGDGDDNVSISAQTDSSNYMHFRNTVRGTATGARGNIDMGSGKDVLTVYSKVEDTTIGTAIGFQGKATLGDGNDFASFIAETKGLRRGQAHGLYQATVDAGLGDDEILIGSAYRSSVDLGDGNDQIIAYNRDTTYQGSTIDGGAGIDRLVLNDTRWDALEEQNRTARLERIYGEGGALGREGLTAEQSYFARTFDIQNQQIGSVGNDNSDSFKWMGGTFENIEQIAVAGGVFDTSTSSFVI